jgi:predicted 3-demethylubiquinone-9 3-methyltransferase (glyoxalase superfamily)
MQKIVPCLWFDKDAGAVAEYYAGVFDGAKIKHVEAGMTGPGGAFSTAEIEIFGYTFFLLAAGPNFKPNPAISFFVNFDPSRDEGAREKLDRLWGKLSDGGTALMPLQEYPFSQRYGWVKDRYGVSWQIAPRKLLELQRHADRARVQRMNEAMYQMKRLDLAALEKAFGE